MGLPPVNSFCVNHGWNSALFFTRRVFRNLRYSLSLDSRTFPFRIISRAPLLYWGFRSIISSPIFLEEYPKLLEELYGAFHKTWSWVLCPNLLGGIRSCRRIHVSIQPLLSGGVIGGSFWSLGSILKGTPIFSERLLRDADRCPGSLLPTSWSHSPLTMKVLNCNSLRINGVTTREVLWVNLFTQYLTSLCIIVCAFAVKLTVSTHKNVMTFTFTIISPKDVNMWQIKILFFNFWYVIFWMKIQNTALFQYKTFPICIAWFKYRTFLCCDLYFIKIFYICAWNTCFTMLR